MTDRVLIANRGEIATRIGRAVDDLELSSVGVYSADDANASYLTSMTAAVELRGRGPQAYLDSEDIVRAALESGAGWVHPGYGFLSENAGFARRCLEAGLTFVGPRPESLELFGDKSQSRAFACSCDIPVVPGSDGAVSLEQAEAFFATLPPDVSMMIKAASGGGGRGIRVVTDKRELAEAYDRCRSEALAAFGDGRVYVEQLVDEPRHIEVQIVGDATGAVLALGERECSLQRRNQKLIEIAPSPWISQQLRETLFDAAVRLSEAAGYVGLGTVEFLVSKDLPAGYAFIETNARLQVEHTVTEEVFGVDLVQAQIRLARGAVLDELGLPEAARTGPRGFAVQARVNAETITADGSTRAGVGTLHTFGVPTGPGVRVDTAAHPGWQASTRYDSLLAKVIAHSTDPDFASAARRARRALREFAIGGVATNLSLLQALLADPDVLSGTIHTRFIERSLPRLLDVASQLAVADSIDPDGLPVEGEDAQSAPPGGLPPGAPGSVAAGMPGMVVSIVAPGTIVQAGQQIAVLEAMKMEHVITSQAAGVVSRVGPTVGDTVTADAVLIVLEQDSSMTALDNTVAAPGDAAGEDELAGAALQEVNQRHYELSDDFRTEAVTRHHARGHLTVREKIERLCVPGSFVEYGGLIVAAQRQRYDLETLRRRSPADGVVTGIGEVGLDSATSAGLRCVIVGYDYTVLAGTQGHQGHRKVMRMLNLARQQQLPVVLIAEGGGGRAGETDGLNAFGLDIMTFRTFAELSGLVPMVGLVGGLCFAGNASLLGCCDVIIATRDSGLGMGGPAMIEGAGLGVVAAELIGPAPEQSALGVIDVLVDDDEQALAAGRRYLQLVARRAEDYSIHDQSLLRGMIPASHRRSYDLRRLIELMFDVDSVLELRHDFARAMFTGLARVEGRTVGVIANDPAHLAGAVDAGAADKAARFIALCDAFDIPLVLLCDTPGIAVGPAAERGATVRHAARLFLATANATVPVFTIVTRRAFGLGAQAMVAGSVHAPVFTVAWPGAQFGSMGVEGMVTLGYRKELDEIDEPARRRAFFDDKVAETYARGRACVAATHFELDDVIDPAESRRWLVAGLDTARVPPRRHGTKKRVFVDAW